MMKRKEQIAKRKTDSMLGVIVRSPLGAAPEAETID